MHTYTMLNYTLLHYACKVNYFISASRTFTAFAWP